MRNKRIVIIVSHTHWDREWYLTFQDYRRKLVKLTDKLLKLLEDDPDYKYFVFDGQTIVLEDYLEIRPQHADTIKKFVQNGRLLVGPFYILPDEFLVSAEAWVRNLILGHRVASQFGPVMKIGYLPDPFGHISQLPQILQGFDIDSFIFTRGTGDEIDDLGTEFYWQAPDGTRVLAINQLAGYCNACALGYKSVPGPIPKIEFDLKEALKKTKDQLERLVPKASTNVILFNNGCDHLEPQPELPEIIRYLNEKIPDTEFIHGTFSDFIREVQNKNPSLKTHRRELRGGKYHPILSGVLSARMYIKQVNEQAQTLMECYAEPLAAFNWLVNNAEYPAPFLWRAWRLILANHPHDSICGCSIDQVHREMMPRFDQALQIGKSLTYQILNELAAVVDTGIKDEAIALFVFNPLNWERSEVVQTVVELPEEFDQESLEVVDPSGAIVPFTVKTQRFRKDRLSTAFRLFRLMEDLREEASIEKLENVFEHSALGENSSAVAEITFVAERVPAMGYKVFYLREGENDPPKGLVTVVDRTMENEFYKITVNENGSFSLLDKSTATLFENLNLFEDAEDAGDEYDYSPARESAIFTTEKLKGQVELVRFNSVRATFQVKLNWELPAQLTSDRVARSEDRKSCALATFITLKAGSHVVEIETRFDNQVKDHRLRALFPASFRTDHSHAEGHFDVVQRPLALPQAKDWVQKPQPTQPQSGFISVDDSKNGLTVINRGLPEAEVRSENGKTTVALTLLRAVGWLSRDDLKTRRGNAGPSLPTPAAQCLGSHSFRYALCAHRNSWLEAKSHRRAYQFKAPMLVTTTYPHGGKLPKSASFISIEPAELMLSACKKAEKEDALILRFYNIADSQINGVIKFYRPFKKASLVNLHEEYLKDVVVEGNEVTLPIAPHQIVTLMVDFRES